MRMTAHVAPAIARKFANPTLGAAMNIYESREGESPYSGLSCILLLLVAGFVAKLGVATQILHLAH
jgi:hypothetical protein